jgi:hypothetical protein
MKEDEICTGSGKESERHVYIGRFEVFAEVLLRICIGCYFRPCQVI